MLEIWTDLWRDSLLPSLIFSSFYSPVVFFFVPMFCYLVSSEFTWWQTHGILWRPVANNHWKRERYLSARNWRSNECQVKLKTMPRTPVADADASQLPKTIFLLSFIPQLLKIMSQSESRKPRRGIQKR